MASLDDVLDELRAVLVDLSRVDLWPPWDAAQTIVDLVARAQRIASTPPPPDPAVVRDAAADWALIGKDAGLGHDALARLRSGMSPAVWRGRSGDAFRGSVSALAARTDTIQPAAEDAAAALTALAAAMDGARTKHGGAGGELAEHLSISSNDLDPFQLDDTLSGIISAIIAAVHDLVSAYEDAAEGQLACRTAVVTAIDGIDLPTHLPPGVSAIDAVSAWEDEAGPLRGDVLARYGSALDALSSSEREAVEHALAQARTDAERGWIIAGVVSGLTGAALAGYLRHLRRMPGSELSGLDPTSGGRLEQPDGTTCGSSSLVMSRMLNDPAYAMWIRTGYDPLTGEHDPQRPTESAAQAQQRRFAEEAQAMHDRTNALQDRDGELQVPYPQVIGTAPWAVANEMSADDGSGRPGTQYGVDTVDPGDRSASYEALAAAVEGGHTVPMYVGNSVAPGHVVLVTGAVDGRVTAYDPASGDSSTFTRDQYVRGELAFGNPAPPLDRGGPMTEPWFTVVPR